MYRFLLIWILCICYEREWRFLASHSTDYYEEQFKIYIMQMLLGEKKKCLDVFVNEVMNEHFEDMSTIYNAYTNVKRELVG